MFRLLFCKRVGEWILTFTLRLHSQCWVLFLFGILGVDYKWELRQECVLEKAEMSFYSAYLDWEIEQLLHYIFFIST